MEIITTIKITVSPENEKLIPVLVSKNWSKIWEETDSEAIIRLRNESARWNVIWQIRPHVESYFWEFNKDKADQVNQQLENAVEVSTIIIE